MRILHTADLHLGRQFHGISLEDDHADILSQIVQAIQAYRPDAVIIAGDIFDRASPPASSVRQFNDFLGRIARETDAAVIMIAGNHDSGDRIGAMSVMTDTRRALIRGPLLSDETPLILSDEFGPVAFSALPFGYEFAARECFADETIALPADVIKAQISAARKHIPAGARWVIVAHAYVEGGSAGETERPLARVGGIETVRHDAFDGAHYVALGHLHLPHSVGMKHIRYSGAPLAFGFDEAGKTKSMTLVDLDRDGNAEITPVPFMPLRSVRVVRGKLADLLDNPASLDFIKAILTDEAPLIDPMKRLREVFPNACQIVYERDERPLGSQPILVERASMHDPARLVRDFLSHVRNEDPVDPELQLIGAALADLHRAGADA
ncbi:MULTISPECIES: exonuclease SbcCD subunit D [unclassified Sinorhizobium]|uniref:exonuclease SbcCD subunit D n=1 Tax=unclassified Sinorhizobium TaxID=2613772 RepID=UPI0035267C39